MGFNPPKILLIKKLWENLEKNNLDSPKLKTGVHFPLYIFVVIYCFSWMKPSLIILLTIKVRIHNKK